VLGERRGETAEPGPHRVEQRVFFAELGLQRPEIRLDPSLLLVQLVEPPPIVGQLIGRASAVGDETLEQAVELLERG
jgi:hypothetical protein